ncbi:hypothetical protein HY29_14165 [Hyphomonas beringensis]|uniref:Glycosyltransferase 2-like domain-containing protein n=1 Tax=Hyphomonas beringensis TaxID=1280946 RepID=A0A062UCS1_9PROT|nr:glycosyltransferase family 2 protein [Hyphomonas beringensis]KCZ54399.1 hypothetical protein HY29_14165 [Hyphomonas beringensis]
MSCTLDEKKVAIVIPLYNDAPNIERAIRSACEQKLPDGLSVEVIVVDDCSQDGGPDIVDSLTSEFSNLKFYRQSKNGGPSAARNRALKETDAAWFTPLDSDDFMEQSRIADLHAIAEEKQLDLVADNLLMSSEATPNQVERELWPDKPAGPIQLSASFFVNRSYDVDVERSELGFIKPLIHRAKLKDPSAPYVEDLRFGEDFELYTRMLLDGASAMLVDPAGYYLVRRSGSASHSQAGKDHQRLARICRQMLKRPDLSALERRAIRGHLDYSEKEWATWTLIEGARKRDMMACAKALFISPVAAGHVIQLLGQKALKRTPVNN